MEANLPRQSANLTSLQQASKLFLTVLFASDPVLRSLQLTAVQLKNHAEQLCGGARAGVAQFHFLLPHSDLRLCTVGEINLAFPGLWRFKSGNKMTWPGCVRACPILYAKMCKSEITETWMNSKVTLKKKRNKTKHQSTCDSILMVAIFKSF